MPESRSTTQRLQLAAVNLAGALILAFIAWKAAAWAIDFRESVAPAPATRTSAAPIAIYLVAGFAALLAVAAISNAAYLTFRRQD